VIKKDLAMVWRGSLKHDGRAQKNRGKSKKRGLNVGNANDSQDWSPNGIAQYGGLII